MKIWLVVLTILKNISQLGYVGIILPNVWKNMCQTTNQILGLYNSSNSPASVFFDVAECCIVVATRNVLGYWDPRQILYRNIGVYIYMSYVWVHPKHSMVYRFTTYNGLIRILFPWVFDFDPHLRYKQK